MSADRPNGRYRGLESPDDATDPAGEDEPPTRPGTPLAKLTPHAGTVIDGPVTRADLATFKRDLLADFDTRAAELLEAVKAALNDRVTHADAALHRRVEALEKAYRAEQPTLSEGLDG